jgi:L,D-transpeptidase catalytic domain
MLLSRRQIVQAGAVSGALALMPSVAFAQAGDPLPAAPRVQLDPMVDPRLVARARASFDRHRAELAHVDTVAVVDFTKASSDPRFFIIDTTSGRVTRHLVAHGRGSDPEHTGFVQRFSNEIRSEATSNGAYVMGDYYPGHYGRSMRVRGLDYTNSNAEARAIVVHSAWYAEPGVLASNGGLLGRSEGCFALPYASLQEVLERVGPGRFLYAERMA